MNNETATGSSLSCYLNWIATELQKKEFGEVSIKFVVRDENRIAALGGESTVSRVILPAKINPTTNRLLTETNIVNSSGIVINPATSDNQTNGSQKTQIVDSNNKTIVPTTPTDIQLSELIPVLRSLITAIANPSYVDKSANQMRVS